MKKVYAAALAGLLVLGFQFSGITNSFTPPAARTGAPGELTCNASGCHAGTLNAGGGSVGFISPPASYVPGTTYNFLIHVSDPNRSRFGFQVTALDAANNKQGNFSLVTPANTSIQNQGNRQYVNHLNAGSTVMWNFNWTAPATNVGPVTFYLAGNAADNNGSTNGDNIYNATYVLQPATSTGVLDADAGLAVSVYPSPATAKLFISGSSLTQTTRLQITDITGKFIRSIAKVRPADFLEMDISDLPPGIYVLHFETKEGRQITKKFVVA